MATNFVSQANGYSSMPAGSRGASDGDLFEKNNWNDNQDPELMWTPNTNMNDTTPVGGVSDMTPMPGVKKDKEGDEGKKPTAEWEDF